MQRLAPRMSYIIFFSYFDCFFRVYAQAFLAGIRRTILFVNKSNKEQKVTYIGASGSVIKYVNVETEGIGVRDSNTDVINLLPFEVALLFLPQ